MGNVQTWVVLGPVFLQIRNFLNETLTADCCKALRKAAVTAASQKRAPRSPHSWRCTLHLGEENHSHLLGSINSSVSWDVVVPLGI